jgi:hypothetical protein
VTEPDLKDDAWTSPRVDITPGDVYIAPHPALARDPAVFLFPDVHEDPAITVAVGYALVIATHASTVSYVPIATEVLYSDPGALRELAAHARPAHLLRLPPLEGEWEEPVIAFLRMPQTLNRNLLADRRVASMRDEARAVLRRRLLQAFAHDR